MRATGPVPGPDRLALALSERLAPPGMNVGDHTHLDPGDADGAAKWSPKGSPRDEEADADGIVNAFGRHTAMRRGTDSGEAPVRLPHG